MDKSIIKIEWYKDIIHAATEGFVITNIYGDILDVNEAFCRMHGYSRQEMLSIGIYDVDCNFIGMSLNKKREELKRWLPKIRDYKGFREAKHIHKNGTIIIISISLKYMDVLGGI